MSDLWEKFANARFFFFLALVTILIIWFTWLDDSHEKYQFDKRKYRGRDVAKFFQGDEFTFRGEKIVHLDLKGAPPKLSYYKDFFKLITRLGATGILIEYEDMFPFRGALLGNTSAYNAYTLEEVHQINEWARELNLTVIPLIQTFGHLEWLLKGAQWMDLREVRDSPQALCPTNKHTVPLLKDMLRQVQITDTPLLILQQVKFVLFI